MKSISPDGGISRGVVDHHAPGRPPLCTRYSTDGAVAIRVRSNSRSRRSRTISMCSSPRNPQRNPKPRAPGGLGGVGEAGVVQPQLLERLAQVGELVAVDRVQPAEHHGLGVAVALEGRRRPGRLGHRLAGAGLAHVLDPGDQVADLPGPELGHRGRLGPAHADLVGVVGGPGLHEPQAGAGAQPAVHDPHRADHPAVLVEVGVEDERLEGRVGVAHRRRDPLDHRVEQLGHALRPSWR